MNVLMGVSCTCTEAAAGYRPEELLSYREREYSAGQALSNGVQTLVCTHQGALEFLLIFETCDYKTS